MVEQKSYKLKLALTLVTAWANCFCWHCDSGVQFCMTVHRRWRWNEHIIDQNVLAQRLCFEEEAHRVREPPVSRRSHHPSSGVSTQQKPLCLWRRTASRGMCIDVCMLWWCWSENFLSPDVPTIHRLESRHNKNLCVCGAWGMCVCVCIYIYICYSGFGLRTSCYLMLPFTITTAKAWSLGSGLR